MKKKNNVALPEDNHNYDNEGNVLPAFPTSASDQKDKAKTSVGFTVVAWILHILAFLPIIAATLVLGIYCYKLVPYYTFWPFVGTILVGLFAIIFYVISIVVARKNSKSSIRTQTVKIIITFVCLTTVFGALITYVFPDVIAFATQKTLLVEDLLYKGESQADQNAKLERDFIRYNILAGNLGTELSYYDMNKHQEDSNGIILSYDNEEIQASYDKYIEMENNSEGSLNTMIALMKSSNSLKYELYNFIYSSYVLIDFDYAFLAEITDTGVDCTERHAITLAMVDYIYTHGSYEQQIKDGFKDPEIKRLFDVNFDSFNQDGYLSFDDSPLLFAQVNGRMTIPIVLRLILNESWMYSQPSFTDESGTKYNWVTGENETVFIPEYYEDSNYLLEMYDPICWEKFEALGLEYDKTGSNGKSFGYYVNSTDVNDKYNGWIVYEDGIVKRPCNWLVLDMLGDPMSLAAIDLNSDVGGIVTTVLSMLPNLVGAVGNLLTEGLTPVLEYATGGASLTIGLYIDDAGQLQIGLFTNNTTYSMLGFMQASWVQQDSLLFAVINVIATRNWLCLFGAVGAVLIIASGVLREAGQKTREKAEKSRDRIKREKAAAESGITEENVSKPEVEELDLEAAE